MIPCCGVTSHPIASSSPTADRHRGMGLATCFSGMPTYDCSTNLRVSEQTPVPANSPSVLLNSARSTGNRHPTHAPTPRQAPALTPDCQRRPIAMRYPRIPALLRLQQTAPYPRPTYHPATPCRPFPISGDPLAEIPHRRATTPPTPPPRSGSPRLPGHQPRLALRPPNRLPHRGPTHVGNPGRVHRRGRPGGSVAPTHPWGTRLVLSVKRETLHAPSTCCAARCCTALAVTQPRTTSADATLKARAHPARSRSARSGYWSSRTDKSRKRDGGAGNRASRHSRTYATAANRTLSWPATSSATSRPGCHQLTVQGTAAPDG